MQKHVEVVNYELIPTLSFYLLFFLVLVTLHIFCCSYILEKKQYIYCKIVKLKICHVKTMAFQTKISFIRLPQWQKSCVFMCVSPAKQGS